jgi:hypothetical protein
MQKEKELIERKMQRIEKAKEQEVADLRNRINDAQGDVRAQLKVKDDRIVQVMDDLASVNALYNEAQGELEVRRVHACVKARMEVCMRARMHGGFLPAWGCRKLHACIQI